VQRPSAFRIRGRVYRRGRAFLGGSAPSLPTLNLGDCASPAAEAAMIVAAASRLGEHRIGYAPVASHLPGLDGIEMSGTDGLSRVLVGDAPVSIQFHPRWLNVT
jgi:hypothetical protein